MFNEAGQLTHGVVCRGGGGKGGGGGGAAPQPTTLTDPVSGMAFTSDPFSEAMGGQTAAQQLNAEIQQRQAQEAATAAANTATAQQTAATNEQNFQSAKQGAINQATTNVGNAFRGAGVDPAAYTAGYIQPAIASQAATIQDLSPNPMSAFPSSLGQTILNQATADQRTQALNQFNQTYSPTYSANAIPTSMVAPAVQSILGQQFDPLSQELTNAQKRGTLNPQGYQAALAKMAQDKSAAQSTLTNLGNTIVGSDRSAIDALTGSARSDISGAALGQSPNQAQYGTQIGDLVNQDVSGFSGALQNAAGNTQFADIQDLLNAGGSVQGATSPSAANPGTAGGGVIPDPTANARRGLGSTGA